MTRSNQQRRDRCFEQSLRKAIRNSSSTTNPKGTCQ
jgi:hypothetical protein